MLALYRGYETGLDTFWTSWGPATALVLLLLQLIISFPVSSKLKKEIAATKSQFSNRSLTTRTQAEFDVINSIKVTPVVPFYLELMALGFPTFLLVREQIAKAKERKKGSQPDDPDYPPTPPNPEQPIHPGFQPPHPNQPVYPAPPNPGQPIAGNPIPQPSQPSQEILVPGQERFKRF